MFWKEGFAKESKLMAQKQTDPDFRIGCTNVAMIRLNSDIQGGKT